jgi:hypothetical protein
LNIRLLFILCGKDGNVKIVILDGMGKQSPIYHACTGITEWRQPKERDVIITDDPLLFTKEAEMADFLFADPGELGDTHCVIRSADRLLFDFMTEHPSKTLSFVMRFPVQYYQSMIIFKLVNVDTINSNLSDWWIAKKLAKWLFKNAPLDLFTKDWTNLQEIEEYLPRLGMKTARRVYSQLYDGSEVPKDFPKHHLINLIRSYYKDRWRTEMKLRGVKNF